MLLSNILLTLGVAALSLGLRTVRHPWVQKLGAIGILVTSYLAGHLLTGSWVFGLVCALSWFFLPWLDLLTRIRKLSLPLERPLVHTPPPNAETFPELRELTADLEDEGFEHVDDMGWQWEEYRQFFRIFHKADERAQAAICLVEQHEVSFYFLTISSRGKDGTLWTTWNYPFPYSLKLVPQWRVNRPGAEQTFYELMESHRQWLRVKGVAQTSLQEIDPEAIQAEIQRDLQTQVTHNLNEGVLVRIATGEVQYTWRGLVFLWVQFLRDLLRVS